MESATQMNRTIEISGMTGDECVQKVTTALKAAGGVSVQSVKVGSATIGADAAGCTKACSAIEAAGYKPTERLGQNAGQGSGQKSDRNGGQNADRNAVQASGQKADRTSGQNAPQAAAAGSSQKTGATPTPTPTPAPDAGYAVEDATKGRVTESTDPKAPVGTAAAPAGVPN